MEIILSLGDKRGTKNVFLKIKNLVSGALRHFLIVKKCPHRLLRPSKKPFLVSLWHIGTKWGQNFSFFFTKVLSIVYICFVKIAHGFKFRSPKIYAKGDKWHIFFSFLNPDTGKFQRFKIYEDINRQSSDTARLLRAKYWVAVYDKILKEGYNPFATEAEESVGEERVLEIISKFLEDKRSSCVTSQYKYYVIALGLFEDYFRQTGLENVSSKEIQLKLEQHWKEKKWANATFNNYAARITSFFNHLEKNSTIVLKNKFFLKKKVAVVGAHPPFSDSDFAKFTAAAKERESFWLYWQFLYYTCIRPVEATRLRVRHVDLNQNKIVIPPELSKTGKSTGTSRVVRIDHQLLPILHVLIQDADPDHFLFGRKKQLAQHHMYEVFDTIRKQTGINPKVTLYSVKSTRCCHLVQAGTPLYRIQELTGHTTLSQLMTYLRGMNVLLTEDYVYPVREF